MNKSDLPKYLFSLAFILLAAEKVLHKDSSIDATVTVLVFLVFLPWIRSFVKGVEIPAFGTITLADVADVTNRFEVTKQEVTTVELLEPVPSFLEVLNIDPNLALAGYRIELEKRLQKLARLYDIDSGLPLNSILHKLTSKNIISEQQSTGYEDILHYAEKAMHGARVEPRVVEWIKTKGKRFLDILDVEILKNEERDFSREVKDAKIILKYHGQDVIAAARDLLSISRADSKVILSSSYLTETPKAVAKVVLVRIGALVMTADYPGNKEQYQLTKFGEAIYKGL